MLSDLKDVTPENVDDFLKENNAKYEISYPYYPHPLDLAFRGRHDLIEPIITSDHGMLNAKLAHYCNRFLSNKEEESFGIQVFKHFESNKAARLLRLMERHGYQLTPQDIVASVLRMMKNTHEKHGSYITVGLSKYVRDKGIKIKCYVLRERIIHACILDDDIHLSECDIRIIIYKFSDSRYFRAASHSVFYWRFNCLRAALKKKDYVVADALLRANVKPINCDKDVDYVDVLIKDLNYESLPEEEQKAWKIVMEQLLRFRAPLNTTQRRFVEDVMEIKPENVMWSTYWFDALEDVNACCTITDSKKHLIQIAILHGGPKDYNRILQHRHFDPMSVPCNLIDWILGPELEKCPKDSIDGFLTDILQAGAVATAEQVKTLTARGIDVFKISQDNNRKLYKRVTEAEDNTVRYQKLLEDSNGRFEVLAERLLMVEGLSRGIMNHVVPAIEGGGRLAIDT